MFSPYFVVMILGCTRINLPRRLRDLLLSVSKVRSGVDVVCLLIFLHIEATWLLKFSRSSMCTPSNLQVVEGSINVPSTEEINFIFLCLVGFGIYSSEN